MAGPQLSRVLADFEMVVERMRDRGVASWVGSPVGDLVLGPAPMTRKQLKASTDPKEARRSYYTDILGRPVTDAEMEKLP